MVFKDIVGYEGLYSINEKAQIWSKPRTIKKHFFGGKYIYHHKKERYNTCHLSKDGKTRTFLVHRLVAKAFIPNPNGYKVVHHIDGNKNNNNAKNLEWCSFKDNIDRHYDSGAVSGRRKLSDKDVRDIRERLIIWSDNKPDKIAKEYVVDPTNIRRIARNVSFKNVK